MGSPNRQKLYSGVLDFFKLLFCVLLWLGGLVAWVAFIASNIKDDSLAGYLVWFYLLGSLVLYLCFKHRNSLTKENFSRFLSKTKEIIRKILKFSFYLVLAAIGIALLFLVGGWVASLSATTVIIILLFLILLK